MRGQTILSTIFKFAHHDPGLTASTKRARLEALRQLAIEGSENWIVMADECQPHPGEGPRGPSCGPPSPTPSVSASPATPGQERRPRHLSQLRGSGASPYLDKYGIDDAVRDGATVPIYYMARKTEWHLHDKEIDVLFDQWFAGEPDEIVQELKSRGVTRGHLARFEPRIRLIATDIWAHYRQHVMPDGFKAQIVAIDRRACVAYKVALDKVIAKSLVAQQGSRSRGGVRHGQPR